LEKIKHVDDEIAIEVVQVYVACHTSGKTSGMSYYGKYDFCFSPLY